MKTLSDFKRKIQTGVKVHTVWYNKGQAIDKGIREVKTVQSNSFSLLTGENESWLEFPKAKDITIINKDTINIYQQGNLTIIYTFV